MTDKIDKGGTIAIRIIKISANPVPIEENDYVISLDKTKKKVVGGIHG